MLTDATSPFIYYQRLFNDILKDRKKGIQTCMELSDIETETFYLFLGKSYLGRKLANQVREVLRIGRSIRNEAYAKNLSPNQVFEQRFASPNALLNQPNPFANAFADARKMLSKNVRYDRHGRVVLGESLTREGLEHSTMTKYALDIIERYKQEINMYQERKDAAEKKVEELTLSKKTSSQCQLEDIKKSIRNEQQNARRFKYIINSIEKTPRYKEALRWIEVNSNDSSATLPATLKTEPGYMQLLIIAERKLRQSRQGRNLRNG